MSYRGGGRTKYRENDSIECIIQWEIYSYMYNMYIPIYNIEYIISTYFVLPVSYVLTYYCVIGIIFPSAGSAGMTNGEFIYCVRERHAG